MRRRKNRIVFYLNDEEMKMLNEKCAAAGLRRDPLLRQLVNGLEIKPRPPDSYRELAKELSAIGNNINQIAHVANLTGVVQSREIEQVTQYMAEVWRLVQERV